VVASQSGELISRFDSESSSNWVRLVTFIPGRPLAKVEQTPALLFDLGKKLGELRCALVGFDHDSFHRDFHWDLANGLRVVRQHGILLRDAKLRQEVEHFASCFQSSFSSQLVSLPRSVIHGDANDYNVIVENENVAGLIDYGDMVYSYTVGDLAVALAYVVLDKSDPLSSVREVIDGYLSKVSLNEIELELLWPLTLMRLCMSVCMAAFQQQQNPDNEYLDISQQAIRNSLPELFAMGSPIL